MIYQKGTQNEATGIYKVVNERTLSATAAYRGTRLYWQPANCCYSKGMWLNALPWRNDYGWKNNA